jgi:hypothetical protein
MWSTLTCTYPPTHSPTYLPISFFLCTSYSYLLPTIIQCTYMLISFISPTCLLTYQKILSHDLNMGKKMTKQIVHYPPITMTNQMVYYSINKKDHPNHQTCFKTFVQNDDIIWYFWHMSKWVFFTNFIVNKPFSSNGTSNIHSKILLFTYFKYWTIEIHEFLPTTQFNKKTA